MVLLDDYNKKFGFNKKITPEVEDLISNEHTMVIASDDSLEEAVYESASQAVKHIQNSLGIEWEDAYVFASLSVDLKISQVVDPKVTVRAAIPKHVISTQKLIESI